MRAEKNQIELLGQYPEALLRQQAVGCMFEAEFCKIEPPLPAIAQCEWRDENTRKMKCPNQNCGTETSGRNYCDACGTLLQTAYTREALRELIRTEVKDKDVVVTSAAIEVTEKAFKWIKSSFVAVGLLVAVMLGILGWQYHGIWTAIEEAKGNATKVKAEYNQLEKDAQKYKEVGNKLDRLQQELQSKTEAIEKSQKGIAKSVELLQSDVNTIKTADRILSAIVIDTNSKLPIRDAKVFCETPEPTLTERDGHFHCNVPPHAHTIKIVIEADGYESSEKRVSIDSVKPIELVPRRP